LTRLNLYDIIDSTKDKPYKKEGDNKMKVGYVRVSTTEQNTARQEVLMEKLGVDKMFIEKVSGKDKKRPQLQEMMSFIREGDTLIVESISRFARNTKDLLELTEKLTEKGVEFISQKESIDTSTPSGKFMLTVFAALAQMEREVLLERQREGIEEAKRLGKYKGRKPIAVDEDLFAEQYRLWKNGETQPKYMMRALGLKPATFYRRVRAYEEKHGIRK
jgi:DNA invertase Pin-like site-specific DNA recombinase